MHTLANLKSRAATLKLHVAGFRPHVPFANARSRTANRTPAPTPALRPYLPSGPIVNHLDRDQLYSAITFSHASPAHLRALMHYLASATPIPPPHVPPDLVTMNSIVVLRALNQPNHHHPEPPISPDTPAAHNTTTSVELVYPWDANNKPLARSITAPLGATLLGKRIGHTITWPTPQGPAHATIDSLHYQPEREGHHDR